MPKCIDGYAELRKNSPIAISAGENIVTRWSFKEFLDRDALDFYQPDPAWCGGISESLKIMTLVDLHNKRIALHGYCVPVCAQLTSIFTANTCPTSEYLLYITPSAQYFYKHPVIPKDGVLQLPDCAGIGLDIDESKVTHSWFMD
jgi:L-alanine-DL-glutamate epimerase-like enolase superfamily enzyme